MDGVQGNDELLRRGTRSTPTSRGGQRDAVRATVSTSFVPAEADRPIGVWCVPPVINPVWRNRNLKRTRNPRPLRSKSSRRLPLQPHFDSDWSVDQRLLAGPRRESQKSQKIIGTRNVRSLDIRGHIGVSPERAGETRAVKMIQPRFAMCIRGSRPKAIRESRLRASVGVT